MGGHSLVILSVLTLYLEEEDGPPLFPSHPSPMILLNVH